MNPKWYTHKDFKTQPWKNGLGETLELFRKQDPINPENFLFRLSIASVKTSGPFSLYPEMDRLLILLEGEKLHLNRGDGSELILLPLEVLAFTGEEKITSHVTSPCRDFNVMTQRSWGSSKASILSAKQGCKLSLPRKSFVYQLNGILKYGQIEKSAQTLWETEEGILVEPMTDSTLILVEIILADNKHKAY